MDSVVVAVPRMNAPLEKGPHTFGGRIDLSTVELGHHSPDVGGELLQSFFAPLRPIRLVAIGDGLVHVRAESRQHSACAAESSGCFCNGEGWRCIICYQGLDPLAQPVGMVRRWREAWLPLPRHHDHGMHFLIQGARVAKEQLGERHAEGMAHAKQQANGGQRAPLPPSPDLIGMDADGLGKQVIRPRPTSTACANEGIECRDAVGL